MLRRVALFVIIVSGVLNWTVAEAFAAPSGGVVEEYTESVYRVDESEGDGVARTLVEHRVVDRRGKVKSRQTYRTENASAGSRVGRPFEAMPFACSHQGYRAGFEPKARKEIVEDGNRNDFVQFQFFPFKQGQARYDPDTRQDTQQWLWCATGGIDSNNGSRLVISGPGVAYGDSRTTHKIGQVWKEGSTPASYNLSLGFSTEGPVKVNGGVSQTPTKSLRGSPRPPYRDDSDVFSRNGVNGWWEDSCAPDCVGTGGSTNFQGSVVEGLWEFPDTMSVMVSDFVMSGWKKTFCSNPFGCRP